MFLVSYICKVACHMELRAIPICGRTDSQPSVGSVGVLLAEHLSDIKASYVCVRNVQSKQELSLLYRFWGVVRLQGRQPLITRTCLISTKPAGGRVSSAELRKLGVVVSTVILALWRWRQND